MPGPRKWLATDDDREFVGKVIVRRREMRLTQDQLARHLGISTRTLCRYEKLQRGMPIHEFRKLISVLGLSNGKIPLPPTAAVVPNEIAEAWARADDATRLRAALVLLGTTAPEKG